MVSMRVLPTKFIRVKSEVRFQADDPWGSGRRVTFSVDTYGTTFSSVKAVSEDTKEVKWAEGFYRALQSEADGETRFLPESLVELWQTKRVATESLPGLLRRIEPRLQRSDYRPLLHNRKMKIGMILELFICAGLIAIAAVAMVMGEAPLWLAAAVVLGTTLVCWAFLYLVFFRRLSRRKRQMRWLLGSAEAK